MNRSSTNHRNLFRLKLFAIPAIIAGCFLFMSHTTKFSEDFLKALGISLPAANNKITQSLLDGYIDAHGVKNFKNIALGNRTAITKSLLEHTRKQVNSTTFINAYNELRNQKKPVIPALKTPEEMQQGIVSEAKKSIAELEIKIKTSDANMKPVFEKTLESVKKQLKIAEDPNSPYIAGYRNGYAVLQKNRDDSYAKSLAIWESAYPADPQHFIKQRLTEFLNETKDIDFSAELVEKKGIYYFANPAYERKSDRWKMAFRAGKEVVLPARTYVEEWLK